MHKRMIYSLCIMVIVIGCKPRTRYDNKPPENGEFVKEQVMPRFGKITMKEYYENGVLVRSVGLYPDGKKAMERFVKEQGALFDSVRLYFRNGNLQRVYVSKNFGNEYSMQEYYENGQLQWTGNQNMPQEKEYYENGQIKSRLVWQNGEVRKKLLWYKNGQRQEESSWKGDQLHGERFVWDSNGTLVAKEIYQNGNKTQ